MATATANSACSNQPTPVDGNGDGQLGLLEREVVQPAPQASNVIQSRSACACSADNAWHNFHSTRSALSARFVVFRAMLRNGKPLHQIRTVVAHVADGWIDLPDFHDAVIGLERRRFFLPNSAAPIVSACVDDIARQFRDDPAIAQALGG